jgi:hypothetical protein
VNADIRGMVLVVLVVLLIPVGLTAISVRNFKQDCDTTGGHFALTLTLATCVYGDDQ